jgi:hypothetical protein
MAKAKLTPADEKFIAKFLNANNELDFDANIVHKRSNIYTGETVEVDPICAAAIDFVLKVQAAMYKGESALQKISPHLKMSNAVSNFDRARYLVLKLDSKAYMTLLD